MNWRGIWHLGSRYLRQNRVKTALLVSAFSLVWLLPALVALVVSQAESHLRERAESTPLLLGRTGSPLELVFNGLYFTKPKQAVFPIGEARSNARDNEAVKVIPIYARFSAGPHRIVGTTVDYFPFRDLSLARGRVFVRMGECVVGSEVAKREGLDVGDAVISSPGSMFDLAGVYPLKMTIRGILAQQGTPDDGAIFTDLKTAWIIEGLGHGHEEAKKIGEQGRLSGDDEDESSLIKLNASVEHYNEVTAENAGSFHFHGDESDYPITAAIVLPETAKAQALFKGRFQDRPDMQVVSPPLVMTELFDTVFRIQRVVLGVLLLIGLATLAIGCLVFLLSYRLRIREFQSLSNLGADPVLMRWLIGYEALFVLCLSLLCAGGILLLVKLLLPLVYP